MLTFYYMNWTLKKNGYALVLRSNLRFVRDLSAITLERVAELRGRWVVYDPHEPEGWLLVGDDKGELVRETIERLDLRDPPAPVRIKGTP